MSFYVKDRWIYFNHDWTQVMADFHIKISRETFNRLEKIAIEIKNN
jgi:hypothetical protein